MAAVETLAAAVVQVARPAPELAARLAPSDWKDHYRERTLQAIQAE
jgi:hypothetical protein